MTGFNPRFQAESDKNKNKKPTTVAQPNTQIKDDNKENNSEVKLNLQPAQEQQENIEQSTPPGLHV